MTLESIAALIMKNDMTLNRFIKHQSQFNNDVVAKLNEIQKIVSTVEEHTAKISQLQTNYTTLTREVDSLRTTITDGIFPSAQLTMTGLPGTLHDEPRVIVEKILNALDLSHLNSDILDIREITRRAPGPHNQGSNDENLPMSKSLIVRFKSPHICSYVLSKKRAKGMLKIRHVFSLESQGNIFVNEFLHPHTYKLLRKTKSTAAERGWKYVWTRDGRIHARKLDGQPPIRILSESDLSKLV